MRRLQIISNHLNPNQQQQTSKAKFSIDVASSLWDFENSRERTHSNLSSFLIQFQNNSISINPSICSSNQQPYSSSLFLVNGKWNEIIETVRNRLKEHHKTMNVNTKIVQRASVLCPIFERNNELYLILTKRSKHLKSHSGEVCFPGGKMDFGEDAPTTALRETEEEIGIPREKITIVGHYDQILGRKLQLVTPFVGFVSKDFTVKTNESEVEDIFYVPLRFFLEPKFVHFHKVYWIDNEEFISPYFFYTDPNGKSFIIWGLTALAICRMFEICFNVCIGTPNIHSILQRWFESAQESDGKTYQQM